MAYNGYYEFTISQIDYGHQEISDFDNETLFMNIYHYWCFSNYLSMYYIWRYTALNRLKSDIRKKWCKDLTNVNLFIELIDEDMNQLIRPIFILILKTILLKFYY